MPDEIIEEVQTTETETPEVETPEVEATESSETVDPVEAAVQERLAQTKEGFDLPPASSVVRLHLNPKTA